MQFADVGVVAGVWISFIVNNLQFSVLVHVAVMPSNIAVLVSLLVPELPMLPAHTIEHS